MLQLFLVLAAMAAQFAAERTVDAAEGRPRTLVPDRADFVNTIWPATRAMLRGDSARPFYGDGPGAIYPPQFIALVAPFGLLNREAALLVSLVATGGLLVGVVLSWSRPGARWTAPAVAMVLSAPALFALRMDHLMSAVGLAALTAAVFAHRRGRWGVFGAACAVALCRPSNAVPVILLMAFAVGPRVIPLLRATAGGLAVLAPLTLAAWAWDAHWLSDYQASVHAFHFVGLARLAEVPFGSAGLFVMIAALAFPGAIAGWRNRGRALELDKVSVLMAATVLIANGAGVYGAIFCLPAALRLAHRPRMAASAWVFGALPLVVIIAVSPLLLSRDPGRAAAFVSLSALALPLAVLPLLRRPPGALESLPSAAQQMPR